MDHIDVLVDDRGIAAGACRTDLRALTVAVLTRGMTVVDQLGVAKDGRNRAIWGSLVDGPPNVTVCWEIDIPRWKEALYRVLR